MTLGPSSSADILERPIRRSATHRAHERMLVLARRLHREIAKAPKPVQSAR